MSTTHKTQTPPTQLLRWRTVDLVTTVMIGVVFGVIFIGWGSVTNLATPAFLALPPLSGILGGFWWLPAVVAALVIRRPGAALLAELVAASVEPLLGGQWGLFTVVSGAIQGVGVELGFLIFAYRRFGVVPAVLGGAIAGLLEAPWEWRAYYPEWVPGWAGLYAVTMVVSGALIAGLGGSLLTGVLARTGALAPFPIGRAHAESRQV